MNWKVAIAALVLPIAACAQAPETIVVTATPEPTATEVPATATPAQTATPQPTNTPEKPDGVWDMTIAEAKEHLNDAGYSFGIPVGIENMLVDATSGAPDCKLHAMARTNSASVSLVAVAFPGVNVTEECGNLYVEYFIDAGVSYEAMEGLVALMSDENLERINSGDTLKGGVDSFEYFIEIDDGTLYIGVIHADQNPGA